MVVPWLIGFLTFMALEGVAIVYSSVLRDHIYGVCFLLSSIFISIDKSILLQRFDRFSKTEVTFFFVRTVVNVSSLSF